MIRLDGRHWTSLEEDAPNVMGPWVHRYSTNPCCAIELEAEGQLSIYVLMRETLVGSGRPIALYRTGACWPEDGEPLYELITRRIVIREQPPAEILRLIWTHGERAGSGVT